MIQCPTDVLRIARFAAAYMPCSEPLLARESPIEPVFPDGFETFAPDLMRLSRLQLRDPHLFASVVICIDVTDSCNAEIDAAVNQDGDADGLLDASPLLAMEPFAPPRTRA